MTRAIRVCLWVMIVAALLQVPGRATAQSPAQVTLPNEYSNTNCGLAFRYPQGWTTDSIQGYLFVIAPETVAFGIIGGIRNVPAAPLSPQSAAAAAAGAFCLDCLRTPPDKLVWVERLTEGSVTAGQIVFRETAQDFLSFLQGQQFQAIPGYTMWFFLFEDGSMRNLGSGRWTTGQANFWVREDLIRQYEPWITAIVRSLRFTPAPQDCWG